MARHLTKVADSGAQDSNKFPSNIYNHNDNLKFTDKDSEIAAERTGDWSETPANVNVHIPLNESYPFDCRQTFEMIENYKRYWSIPVSYTHLTLPTIYSV